MKGAYALVLRLACRLNINVGSLGPIEFESGIWVYIGSAMGEGSTSLEKRLQRHFSQDKSIFWHIDTLISSGAKPSYVIWAESNEKIECEISEALSKSPYFHPGPKGFGSSDCQRNCGTHIFQHIGKHPVVEALEEAFLNLGLEPQRESFGANT